MQNDLISRSALLVDWKNKLSQMGKWIDGGAPVDFRLVVNALEAAPAVDAVEVVRCKDCKWLYRNNDMCCCTKHTGLALIKPDGSDFCSYGERRDDDGTSQA